MLIDTHAHLSKKEYSFDLDAVIKKAAAAGVEKIISCGFDVQSSLGSLEIAEKYPNVFAALGVHPHDAEKITAEELVRIMVEVSDPRVKAIGEIGLDHYRSLSSPESQKTLFRAFLKMAVEAGKPVIIHSREAGDDVLEILADFQEIKKIVFHCFPADPALADKVLARGYFISFTGTITFKNASAELRKIVETVPLDRVMLETDCPYLAPQEQRGQRNEPAFIVSIARKMAEIRKMSYEEICRITSENAGKFFDI
jgi:TatD DNase family protein